MRGADVVIAGRVLGWHHRGFTLLEALILLAVVALVAGLLLPRYQAWQRAAHRAQAWQALTTLAADLEAKRRANGTYAGAALRDGQPADAGPPALRPATVPARGGARYRLRIVTANDYGYEIHAVPVGDQAGDPCGTLTLTAAGVRGLENAAPGVRIAECWED